MVNISEKRTEKIPPVKIDNDLLFNVGKILREECPQKAKVTIYIMSDSRDIEIEDIAEIKNLEIPSDTYSISMGIEKEEIDLLSGDPIQIEIDLRFPKKNSKIQVKGENATWVQGVSNRLTQEFDKKRLAYRPIVKFEVLRTLLAMVTSALLTYVVGSAFWVLIMNASYAVAFVAGFFYFSTLLIKRFFDWLFPYFEIANENFKPKKVRKLSLALLWGSGLIPTIILRLLGL